MNTHAKRGSKPPTEVPELLGTTDICRMLDLSTSTITRAVAAGILRPAYRMPRTGAFLFTPAEVQRYAATREAAA